MTSSSKTITYGEFLVRYRPLANGIVEGEPDLQMFATFGKDLETVRKTKIDHVWTVVDIDLTTGDAKSFDGEDGDNCWLIVAGYHYVNRIAYMITERPWDDPSIEVVY